MKLYTPKTNFDDLLTKKGHARRGASRIVRWLRSKSPDVMKRYRDAAELAVKEMGISFTVYSNGSNIDRSWPVDVIPRIISAAEWKRISKGLAQRSRALNKFIHDVYNRRRILAEDVVPPDLVLESPNYQKACFNVVPKFEAWAHICGTDLVRDQRGTFHVLEDNLRVPSGVSYMIENREIAKRTLPELFANQSILPVDDYCSNLFQMLVSLAPGDRKKPCVVVLTPGIFNSAYYEHAYLAQGMGVELVEASDLYVTDNDEVYMYTVEREQRVDVIYRRINDDFLDPEVFKKESVLGVPGLMRSWKAGKVALANAPGAGVADDKAIYAFVPAMIRYYLKEEPLLPNVKTYLCRNKPDLDYVLSNINKLVVKPVNESGGYGILVGPHSTASECSRFSSLIEADPENYIAQPTLSLSTAPTFVDESIQPRHLDLRPFILKGKKTWVTSGGLTRVALREGSLVVNSSQGGGSKDTWIIEADS